MREGRQLVRETSRFAAERPARSWWHLVSTLAVFVAALWVAITDFPWVVRVLASVLAGLVHVRLFVIYHDYLHGAIFEKSLVAGAFFRLYGLLALSPPSIWRHTHDHHHRNNARRLGVDAVGSFPVMTTRAFEEAGAASRVFYIISRHPLTIAFGYLTVFFYGFCIQPILTNPRLHKDAIAATVLHLTLLVALAMTRPDIMLLALIVPTFLASAVGSYLFYAQHNFPGVKLRPGENWDYVVAALHSSSFIRMNPLMSWFTGNIGYHHVHHLNARIPFYRLPETMAAIEDLQSPGLTSLSPRDIFRCLRLKLWDRESDRLVSFAEARRARAAASALG